MTQPPLPAAQSQSLGADEAARAVPAQSAEPAWKRELIARRASKGVGARAQWETACDGASPCEPTVPEWKRELAARRKSVPAATAAQHRGMTTEFQFIAGAVLGRSGLGLGQALAVR